MPYSTSAYKIDCPGCNSNTSEIANGYRECGRCPNCGLPQSVLQEIWRVRESHATRQVKDEYEAMAVRAGLAEAKVLRLTRRIERIEEAVADDGDY
jgi:hypothetical protein